MQNTDEAAFLELVSAFPQGGLDLVCELIAKLFTDTTPWIQPGLPTVVGADAAIELVRTWGAAFAGYQLEIRHVASSGTGVLIERVETFGNADGSGSFVLPVVGVADFRDGRIVEWREYYDTALIPGMSR